MAVKKLIACFFGRLAFCSALAFLLCSTTIAQQLEPNPNPQGNIINVIDYAENKVNFYNYGAIHNWPSSLIWNWDTGTIVNFSGIIDNNGTVDNDGIIDNSGTFEDFGTIENFGIIENSGTINNMGFGTIDNYGTIDNSGTINMDWGNNDNYGTIWNWDTGTINNSSIIHNDGTIDNSGTINNSFTIDNDGTINNSGTINNIILGGSIDNHGTIQNDGTIINSLMCTFWNDDTINNTGTINNVGMITNFFGTIDNSGTIKVALVGNIDNKYLSHINNSGTIDNGGSIYNSDSSTIDNSGTINNSFDIGNYGTIDNSGTINNIGFLNRILNYGTIKNMDSGHINNYGTIDNSGTIQNNGTWYNSGNFYNQGIYKGTGTFVGNLHTGSGIVAPGSSAGTMFVDGDYILDGSGILDIEIGGFDAGEYDLLDITGTAYLSGGTIDFSFLSGYDIASEISPGQSLILQFLKAGSIDSFASSITYDFLGNPPGFQYDVFRQDSGLFFQATNTIPAPGAILLGSIGVFFVGWLRIRRTL